MSRGRRVLRLKPVESDGFKFASPSEAGRYDGLKSYVREGLRSTPSADGRMLVCEWGDGVATPKRTQAFVLAGKGRNKYGANAVTVNNIKFGSGQEAARFADLVRQQTAGIIANLKPHPCTYVFIVNDVKVTSYTPDSEYDIVGTGEHVIEDVKSAGTAVARDWPLRKNLMRACFGIEVKEFHTNPRRAKARR